MKQIHRILFLFLFGTYFSFFLGGYAQENFPEKPITFYVHSRPGSAIDLTTRQLVHIATKYSDATILVENKTGGSGVVAMQHVLHKAADGYTILAMTKSFISTILLSQIGIDLSDFQYLAAMVIDQEVLITNRNAPVHTFQQILSDAKEKKGKQKWLGPLVGGVDHLMAVKTWERLDIMGEWIPFEGGSDALAALLGQHGTVYVGNPVDIYGRPDLMIAAVAAPERLAEFAEAPTFKELGYNIENEVLWRGYVAKKGIPAEAMKYLTELLKNVSEDPEWIQFIQKSGAKNELITDTDFSEMVMHDQENAMIYLEKAGLLSLTKNAKVVPSILNLSIGSLLFLLILLYLFFNKRSLLNGDIMVPISLVILSIFLFIETLSFPIGKMGGSAGPAAMPRLWIVGMVLFSVWLLVKAIINPSVQSQESKGVRKAVSLAVLMSLYILATDILGYYLSTFIFILLGVYIMSYKRYLVAILFSAGFVVFSFIVFKIILMVPLPTGILGQ